METINQRFRELRKLCKKTQTEWGTVLGLSVSGVSEIESGRRNVTEQHIIMLSNWKERRINIDWLRTGEGEPLLKLQINDIVARSTQLLGEKDPVFEAFVETYSELDPSDRKVLLNFGMELFKRISEKFED